MRTLPALLLALCALCPRAAHAQEVVSDEVRKARQDFQDRKFGIFVHWGIYSMLADGEWAMWNRRLDRSEYAALSGGFCPSWFSAREWAMAFKEAGAQYVTFTARHHDGFSMFDTKASDYNIVRATPYGRDALKDMAAACAEQGLKLHLYYSHMDWQRADYPLGSTSRELPHDPAGENPASYRAFMREQLTELLTGYGPIGAVWFDGMWDHTESGFDWGLSEQYALIKRLQPKCLVANNHHGAPREGEDIQLFEQDLPGENTAGFSKGQQVSDRLPLETCMTMNRTWGYSIADTAYKSGDEVLRRLVRAAGMNANFLLNVGPRPDGQLPPRALAILERLGRFMAKNSSTILGTRGGGVPPQPWGVTTRKGNTLYIHILNAEKDGQTVSEGLTRVDGRLSLHMPLKGRALSRVTDRAGGQSLDFRREGDGYRIFLPKRPAETDHILEARLN